MEGKGETDVQGKGSRPRVKPRTLRGFQDFLPEQEFHRQRIIDTVRRVFESFGYKPLDTPILERQETLFGAGGEEGVSVDANKQTYRFTDLDQEPVALRYELTVSLARAVAEHINQIVLPFRRYQVGPVFRFDKPKRGRYRQFVQFDADLIGESSLLADAECIALYDAAFSELGIGDYRIHWSNRKLIQDYLAALGIEQYLYVRRRGDLFGERALAFEEKVECYPLIFSALDKLDQLGPEGVKLELMGRREREDEPESAFAETVRLSLSEEQAERLLDFVSIKGDFEEVLAKARQALGEAAESSRGLWEMARTVELIQAMGISEEHCRIDLSIARGLDYYTGTIFEVDLAGLPQYGSVGGGGRYDDLLSRFSSQKIPGIGISIGIDRLFMALWESGRLSPIPSKTQVLIANLLEELEGEYLAMASRLRERGIITEVFPRAAKLNRQFKYADRLAIPVVLLRGEREKGEGVWQVRRLTEEFGEVEAKQEAVAEGEVVEKVAELIGG